MARGIEVVEIEPGQPAIEPFGRRVKQVCCDCRLTHDIRYDLAADGRLIVRAWRDDKMTRRLRAQRTRAKAKRKR